MDLSHLDVPEVTCDWCHKVFKNPRLCYQYFTDPGPVGSQPVRRVCGEMHHNVCHQVMQKRAWYIRSRQEAEEWEHRKALAVIRNEGK